MAYSGSLFSTSIALTSNNANALPAMEYIADYYREEKNVEEKNIETSPEITCKIPEDIKELLENLLIRCQLDSYRQEGYSYSQEAQQLSIFLNENFQQGKRDIVLKVLHELSYIVLIRVLGYVPEKIVTQFINDSALLSALLEVNYPQVKFKKPSTELFCNLLFNASVSSRIDLSVLIAFFTSQNMDFISDFNMFMISNNSLAKNIMPKLLRLVDYSYSHRSFYKDTWSIILTCLLERLPNEIYFQPDTDLKNKFIAYVLKPQTISHLKILSILPSNYQFHKALGRSLLFKNRESNSILAIKLSKGSEDDNEIIKEFLTTEFLASNRLAIGLISSIPTVKSLHYIDDISVYAQDLKSSHAEMETFFGLTKNNKSNLCYIYEAGPEYFTYLYDIEVNSQFFQSQKIALHDLMLLQEKLGLIFHQLIQAYHGKERRYRLLTNTLTHRNNFDRMNGGYGLGRMDAFYKSVEYPNIRMFPYCLADLGDHCIEKNGKYMKMTLNHVTETSTFNDAQESSKIPIPWNEKQITITTVNYLAEYLYAMVLMGARRVLDGKGSWKDVGDGAINVAAEQLCTVMQTIKNKNQMEEYLRSAVNVNVLTRQLQFFMTSEQVAYIEAGAIPFEIFEMNVEVDKDLFLNENAHWHKGFGPAINPNEGLDLGPFGGNNPLTELSKLLNVFVFILSCGKYHLRFTPLIENHESSSCFSNSIFTYFKSANKANPNQLKPINTLDKDNIVNREKQVQDKCSIC